jgi:Nucleotidyltransferase domain
MSIHSDISADNSYGMKLGEASDFLVLVGSHARGDADERSDVDLLVIGEADDTAARSIGGRYGGPINVVSFPTPVFFKHFRSGSLFLEHAFSEGRLLDGCADTWEFLRGTFSVKSNYFSESRKCARICRFLATNMEMYGGHYLAPLVVAYSQVKNASIFFLAHFGRFVFNKDAAVLEASRLLARDDGEFLGNLRHFYDFSVRCQDLKLPFSLERRDLSMRALEAAMSFTEEIRHACRKSHLPTVS